MKIINARWTPNYNLLAIRCDCGLVLFHRADRWTVRCHHCKATADISKLRDALVFGYDHKGGNNEVKVSTHP